MTAELSTARKSDGTVLVAETNAIFLLTRLFRRIRSGCRQSLFFRRGGIFPATLSREADERSLLPFRRDASLDCGSMLGSGVRRLRREETPRRNRQLLSGSFETCQTLAANMLLVELTCEGHLLFCVLWQWRKRETPEPGRRLDEVLFEEIVPAVANAGMVGVEVKINLRTTA